METLAYLYATENSPPALASEQNQQPKNYCTEQIYLPERSQANSVKPEQPNELEQPKYQANFDNPTAWMML